MQIRGGDAYDPRGVAQARTVRQRVRLAKRSQIEADQRDERTPQLVVDLALASGPIPVPHFGRGLVLAR
jgi:hypothetical protein